jgi:hypothetical protein
MTLVTNLLISSAKFAVSPRAMLSTKVNLAANWLAGDAR